MRVLINAVSARIGGAANYIRMIASELAEREPGGTFVFLLPPERAREFRGRWPNVEERSVELGPRSFLARLRFDQMVVPAIVRSERIDVLFSSANMGTFLCPCRQVLLIRNALFFSRVYERSILPTKRLPDRIGERLRRTLVLLSVRRADLVMTPSKAMLNQLTAAIRIGKRPTVVNHYGVSSGSFQSRGGQDPAGHRGTCCRLLFTSLYSEHKNLQTLLQAVEILNQQGLVSMLRTSADPSWEAQPTPFRLRDAEHSARLIREGLLEFTGVVESSAAAGLYREADIFVYPSLVESFGHPLLEAMAARLPVVAAQTPVNVELCGDAALYFSPLDARECACRISEVWTNPRLRSELVEKGSERVSAFTWGNHVARLIEAFRGSEERAR